MSKKSKNKLIISTKILSLVLVGLVLPISFASGQSYKVEFSGWMQPWGSGTASYMEGSVNLPYNGRYEVRTYYNANSGRGQLFEEYKVLVGGGYIGQTSDPNATADGPDYENEYLGEHNFTAGSHQVRLEHLWNYSEVGSQSVHPQNVTFTLKKISNNPPVADAGPDKEVYEEESVRLAGAGSDPDGDPLTYYWSCTGGSLSNRYIAQPNFNAPQVSSDRTYTCTLTVTDTHGASDSDSMNVLVKNYPPTVDIKANNSDGPVTLYYKDYVTLSWTSQNAASCVASGDWSGSKPTSGSNTVQLNSVKTYTFTLTCTDTSGTQTSADSVQVIAKPKPPTVITKPAVVTF